MGRMNTLQPRFLLAAILIHIAMIFALQWGLKRSPIVISLPTQEITARLIAPPQPLPTANVEPPKPQPVKKEIQPPQPRPIPRPVLPKPTEPSERAIEIPAKPASSAEPIEPPRTAQVQEPDPPPPPPVVTQPSHEASYLGNPEMGYPTMSRRLGETGIVLLRVLVTADGKAADVKLKKNQWI